MKKTSYINFFTFWLLIFYLIKKNSFIRFIFRKCKIRSNLKTNSSGKKGSLYLSNHPFISLDKALILNINPEACFVTNNWKKAKVNSVVNKLFFNSKNLILTGGAVSKIINRINNGKDVYIFHEDINEIYIKNSTKIIHNKTNCDVYLMNIDTNIKKSFLKIEKASLNQKFKFWKKIINKLIFGTVIKITYKKININYLNKKILSFFYK